MDVLNKVKMKKMMITIVVLGMAWSGWSMRPVGETYTRKETLAQISARTNEY